AAAALLVSASALACGTPSVKPGVLGDGGLGSSGTLLDGGVEGEAGHPPTCNGNANVPYGNFAIDPAKMSPGATVSVPAGAFDMGCNDAVDPECRDDE